VGRIDVVYVNSLISIRLARPFADRPTVVHVHELGGLADSFGAPAKQLVQTADRILVPSAAALRWVICSGRSAGDVEVLPGAVPPSALEPPTHEAVRALTIRLGITDGDGLIVSTVGWVGALKGSDRFIEVAALLADRLDQPVRFLWVGGGSATEQEQRFRSEIVARGLDAVVTILPAIDDLRPLYALSDVVLLTSREESLSLVALESAAQGTAVVAFPGAGGPDSLAEEGIVICPSTTDVGQVVETILELLLATDRRLALGVEARELVIANHGAAAGQRQLVRVLAEVAGR
jgi:glycosyltransferase involved in cell wall biosynthesis